MKVYSWNVNGIRAMKNKGFLEWMVQEQPDILCLQETKAHVEQLDDDLVNIDGYYSYWNAPERKGYSGVATYTKTKPKSVKYGIGIEDIDKEGRIIIAEYDTFILLNIYFPNGQMNEERLEYKLEFYEAILAYCDHLKAQGHHIIICGDFNTAHNEIDLKNPKANADRSGFLLIERKWLDKLVSLVILTVLDIFILKRLNILGGVIGLEQEKEMLVGELITILYQIILLIKYQMQQF